MSHAFPESYAENNDPKEIVNDPRLAAFLAQVCEFVWLNSRLDATDSEDWQDFKAQFIGGRPVSCALLDHAWQEFANSLNRLVFAEPPRDSQEETPAAVDLDSLTDEQVDATYRSVARAMTHR